MSVMELFKDQSLRWQLIVCIVGQIGQQLSGTSKFSTFNVSIDLE